MIASGQIEGLVSARTQALLKGVGRNPREGLVLNLSRRRSSDRFSLGATLGHNVFHAAVEQAALLLHGAEANGNGRLRHSRNHSGEDLNQALGEHRRLLVAGELLVGGYLGHYRF